MFQFLPMIMGMVQAKKQEEAQAKAREASIRGQGAQAQAQSSSAGGPQSIPMPQLGNPTQPRAESTMGNFVKSGAVSEVDENDPMYKQFLYNQQGGFGGY